MNPKDIPSHLLNQPGDKNKFFLHQGVRPKQVLREGINIGIDLMTINIPYRPLGMTINDPSGKLTSLQIAMEVFHKKEFVSHVHGVHNALIEIFDAVPALKKNKTGPDRLRVVCEEDKSHVAIVMAGHYFGFPFISYSFNPNKLTEAGLIALDGLLSLTLPHGYASLYTEGVVSHCEFFIDVDDVTYGSLALLDRGKRKATTYKDTTYNGTRRSLLVGTRYNTAEKLNLDTLRTRFEFRVKRLDTTLKQLVETITPNPLSPFFIVPATAINTVAKHWPYNPNLAIQIERHGLSGGIKNSTARKSITNQLEGHIVPWWEPESIWIAFRQTMAVLRPNYCFGSTEPCFPSSAAACH
jgi:hypothetical protein